MKPISIAGLGVMLAGGLATTAACRSEKFQLIEVPQLVALGNDARTPVTVLDANEPAFRKKNGVIPGARLLSSFDKYDLSKELPADKDAPLVFYCSNRL